MRFSRILLMGEHKDHPGSITADRPRRGFRAGPLQRGLAPRRAMTVAVILLCMAVIGVAEYVYQSKNPSLTTFDPARTKGNPAAAVRIIEFVDFQCLECAKSAKLLKRYMKDYPEDIFLAVKYYPLGELNSVPSAVYSECAARQGKFWPVHDLLFDRISQWRTLKDVKPFFSVITKDAGLDTDELARCVADDGALSVVRAERAVGGSSFVQATPTYFINGDIVVGVGALRETLEKLFSAQ